jgi:(p)ppGpp synthase/HD superfamily hydrolase
MGVCARGGVWVTISCMQPTPRFEEALSYAARLHAEQRRKRTDVPYVAHLLAVTGIVLEHGGDEDEAIAALLHDAVEDQGGAPRLNEIYQKYGPRVAAIVAACTDTDLTPKPPWRARKDAYLEHLATADRSMQLVSAADKLHNVRSLAEDYRTDGEEVWARFNGGREGTLWYYRAVLERLDKLAGTVIIEQLRRAVEDLERLASGHGD